MKKRWVEKNSGPLSFTANIITEQNSYVITQVDQIFGTTNHVKIFSGMGKFISSWAKSFGWQTNCSGDQVHWRPSQVSAQFFINCLPESQMAVDSMIHSLIIWAPWSNKKLKKPRVCKGTIKSSILLWDSTRTTDLRKAINNFLLLNITQNWRGWKIFFAQLLLILSNIFKMSLYRK